MHGLIVAPQPAAAEVGADILRAGGNAFDATVAAAFMQTVLDPLMCGIGGIGVAQLYAASTGEHIVLDFYGRVGSRADPEMFADRVRTTSAGKQFVEGWANHLGYQSILIPGTIAGLAAIHEGRGRLPWRDLLQPAIATLRERVPLYAYISDYFFETHQFPGGEHNPSFQEFVTTTPEMARLWLRDDGTPRQVGETLVNDDYADTLTCLAEEGADTFYRGSIARRIAADFAAHDAPITAADLANTRAIPRAPLRLNRREVTIATAPPGGATLLQILAILADDDLPALGHNSADYLHLIASTLRIAFGERGQITDDLDNDCLAALIDPVWIAKLRKRIKQTAPAAAEAVPAHGTTHLTVADSEGNVVALTHTLSLGSGVMTPGLGFQYNNGLYSFNPVPGQRRSIAPGRTRVTPMAPTFVMRDHRPVIALGSPGSNAIVSAIAQVLINLLDFGMSPLEAVSATRIHCEGGPLLLETRTPRATVKALAEHGHTIQQRAFAYDSLQGRVQLICASDAGWVGASDPRRDGGLAVRA